MDSKRLGPPIAFGAALVALVGACHKSEFRVPAHAGAGTCAVSIGERRTAVGLDCGPPCGSGNVAKGSCSPDRSWFDGSFCSNDCDVYRDLAICYYGDVVVDVRQLSPPGERLLRTCDWSDAARSNAGRGPVEGRACRG
jgi:hypothetical protein